MKQNITQYSRNELSLIVYNNEQQHDNSKFLLIIIIQSISLYYISDRIMGNKCCGRYIFEDDGRKLKNYLLDIYILT